MGVYVHSALKTVPLFLNKFQKLIPIHDIQVKIIVLAFHLHSVTFPFIDFVFLSILVILL